MKGRPTKGHKAKSKTRNRSKAAKATRARSSKSKKTSKASKARQAAPRRKVTRKLARRSTKATSKTGGRSRVRQDVFGEGNYTASREFRQEQTGFVRRNKNRIPEMGEDAAKALEGREGNELRQAEESARAHSVGED